MSAISLLLLLLLLLLPPNVRCCWYACSCFRPRTSQLVLLLTRPHLIFLLPPVQFHRIIRSFMIQVGARGAPILLIAALQPVSTQSSYCCTSASQLTRQLHYMLKHCETAFQLPLAVRQLPLVAPCIC